MENIKTMNMNLYIVTTKQQIENKNKYSRVYVICENEEKLRNLIKEEITSIRLEASTLDNHKKLILD